jgi:hypothetical protein
MPPSTYRRRLLCSKQIMWSPSAGDGPTEPTNRSPSMLHVLGQVQPPGLSWGQLVPGSRNTRAIPSKTQCLQKHRSQTVWMMLRTQYTCRLLELCATRQACTTFPEEQALTCAAPCTSMSRTQCLPAALTWATAARLVPYLQHTGQHRHPDGNQNRR